MLKQIKKQTLAKSFAKLPLWGKIALPVGAIVVLSLLVKGIKMIVSLALLGGLIYLAASAWMYVKDRQQRRK